MVITDNEVVVVWAAVGAIVGGTAYELSDEDDRLALAFFGAVFWPLIAIAGVLVGAFVVAINLGRAPALLIRWIGGLFTESERDDDDDDDDEDDGPQFPTAIATYSTHAH